MDDISGKIYQTAFEVIVMDGFGALSGKGEAVKEVVRRLSGVFTPELKESDVDKLVRKVWDEK